MVVVPGEEGDFGVLVRHAPLISTLRPGVIKVHNGGSVTEQIFVAGGFAEVTPSRCTVLAEEALPVGEIDRAKAEQRLSDAKDDLLDAKDATDNAVAERQIKVDEEMVRAAGLAVGPSPPQAVLQRLTRRPAGRTDTPQRPSPPS